MKSKAHDQLIQARKKLFCRVIVKNYLCNVLCKFLIQMEVRGGAKSKKRHPSWILLHCGRTVRNSHRRYSIKKVVLTNFAIFTGKNLSWGFFLIKFRAFRLATFLKSDSNTCAFCGIREFLRLPIWKNVYERLPCFLTVSMAYCYIGLKVQDLYYMTASGFRVRVTGLVFVFKSVSLVVNRVQSYIEKPNTFD